MQKYNFIISCKNNNNIILRILLHKNMCHEYVWSSKINRCHENIQQHCVLSQYHLTVFLRCLEL